MNAYEILGVSQTCSQEEIKKAYKKLAIENHPDRTGGDESKMKAINEAWENLKTPEKRQLYDQIQNQNQFGNFHGFQRGFGDHPFEAFEEIFRGRLRKNQDINIRFPVTVEDLYTGKELDIEYRLPEGGMNKAHINIPAGIPNGTKIRFEGLGSKAIPDSPPGTLYVQIIVQPHPIYDVKGQDLIRELELDAIEVMLGCKKTIKCLDNSVIEVTIPEGSESGSFIRIKGKGLPFTRSTQKGNMILALRVKIPKLTDEQKQKLRGIFDEQRKNTDDAAVGVCDSTQ